MQYSDIWRKVRKIVHQYFMESKCEADHWKVQEAEAVQMLHDYMVAPQDLMLHPKRYSNSITNSLGKLRGLHKRAAEAERSSLRNSNKDCP